MNIFSPFIYVKNRIKGIVFGRTRMGDFVNSTYYSFQFLKYSFSKNKIRSKENYRAYLTKQYHILEKGLSLPNPRQNFGKAKIEDLLKRSKEYLEKFGDDDLIQIIRNCLLEYINANPDVGNVYPVMYSNMIGFINGVSYEHLGGTKVMDKAHIDRAAQIDFSEFVQTRVSVRNFSDRKIDYQDIVEAIEMARHAPSVCNRQAWNLHYFEDREMMNVLLKLQAGNSGFMDSIKGLFLVTTDMESFTKLEKNQVFIDGGLFSMNVLLSLHAKGLGSCCLNTCVPFTTEIKIKKIAGVPSNEQLIMMMGLGYLKENFKTAYSTKKSVSEILTRHTT